jgi:leucyl-tRNA synthetase
MKFNTSIAQMMIFINELYKSEKIYKSVLKDFVLLLSPYAPHIAEELWQRLGGKDTLAYYPWPEYNEELTKADKITIVFSVNGKVRGKKEMDADLPDKELEQAALDDINIKKHLEGKQIIRIITVKNKMVNIVVK